MLSLILMSEHPRFVEPMLDYIVEDFESSRIALGDNTLHVGNSFQFVV